MQFPEFGLTAMHLPDGSWDWVAWECEEDENDQPDEAS